MQEKGNRIGVGIEKSYDNLDPSMGPKIIITTEDANVSKEVFLGTETAERSLRSKRSSIPTVVWAGAATASTILAGHQTLQALQDNPDRPTHALIAFLAANTAILYGKVLRSDRKSKEVADLEAKALKDALRTPRVNYSAEFPMEVQGRVLQALDSLTAEGKIPSGYEIYRRDIELRSPDPKRALGIAQGTLYRALSQLETKGIIKREIIPMYGDASGKEHARYQYSRTVPLEEPQEDQG